MLVLRYKILKCSLNRLGLYYRLFLHYRVAYAFFRKELGAAELVAPLVSLSSLSAPLLSGSTTLSVFSPTEVEPFLQDLARRFENDDIENILGEVVQKLCHHPSLFRPEGLAGSDSTWRGVISGLEALVGIKSIAVMISRLPTWNPPNAAANNFEYLSLFGPLLRLGIFSREWVCRYTTCGVFLV